MLKRFRHIRNLGSSTRFDAGDYFCYAKKIAGQLDASAVSLLDEDRYIPGGPRTLWRSILRSMSFSNDQLHLRFESADSRRSFAFNYSDVRRVLAPEARLCAMPTLIVQELTLVRGNVLRHALADLGGDVWLIYAKDLTFVEQQLH